MNTGRVEEHRRTLGDRRLELPRERLQPITDPDNAGAGEPDRRIIGNAVRAVNDRVEALLGAAGAGLDGVYYCPHHPERGGAYDCRKPEPGLLRRAAHDLGIDLATSLTVGNAERDLEAGRRAGTAVAGLVLPGTHSDLPPALATYDSWTRVVRDFLQRLAAPAVTR